MFRRTALLFVLAAVALWSVPGLAAEKEKKAKTAGGKVKSIDAVARRWELGMRRATARPGPSARSARSLSAAIVERHSYSAISRCPTARRPSSSVTR